MVKTGISNLIWSLPIGIWILYFRALSRAPAVSRVIEFLIPTPDDKSIDLSLIGIIGPVKTG